MRTTPGTQDHDVNPKTALQNQDCVPCSAVRIFGGVAARYGFLMALLALTLLAPEETRDVARESLSEAYIAVSVFVALTLAIFYVLEHALNLDTDALLRKYHRWHVPLSAFMGALPGCGGAIVVITQYVAGRTGFASVVAVLTSTMGDAAFLLLAQEPRTALLIYIIGVVVGTLSGYVVEALHGKDFLRRTRSDKPLIRCRSGRKPLGVWLRWPWMAWMVPGIALGIGGAFQFDTDAWFGVLSPLEPTLWLGYGGAILAALMWALSPNAGPSIVNLTSMTTGPHLYRHVLDRVVQDTNFVTVWVISAFLLYEMLMLWTGFDMAGLFTAWEPLVPFLAVLVGFLPGCGPQILITTFYLNGMIPLSAQIGNAISNDGDALFPAIAMAPKTAILATLYTAVPALIVGYGWYFLME